MIELSTRTKASYTYVKDWMMLRECVAGCLGAMQTTSHQNVKLKLRLPEGSPAKFVKISGALQITKRATGKDAEAALGDLRFGDKRGESCDQAPAAVHGPTIKLLYTNATSLQMSLYNWSLRPTIHPRSIYRRIHGRASSRAWKLLEVLLTRTSRGPSVLKKYP